MKDEEVKDLYLKLGYDAVMSFEEFKRKLFRGEIEEFSKEKNNG